MSPFVAVAVGFAFVIACLLFGISMYAIIVMLKEFSQLRTSAIIMENSFKEHMELMQGVQGFVSRGLEGAEEHYVKIQTDYDKLIAYQRSINERLNKIEEQQSSPMDPDITFS